MKLFAVDVFTPNDFPEHTYVAREGADLEKLLERALATPKVVVSISGPSKSGKTVLVEKIVGKVNLIPVSGAEIRTADELWGRVLAWMDAPTSIAASEGTSSAHHVGGEIGGKGGVPILAEASGKAKYDFTHSDSISETETHSDQGIARVAREIAGSAFTVFLDDFHYIVETARTDVARQIKAAAERGIRICVATVPHRADDVVRTNHELRGRLAQVDTSFWSLSELQPIAMTGFAKLNVGISPQLASRLAGEACGSPQLMQRICLDVCFELDIREEQSQLRSIDLDQSRLQAILEQASTHSDFSMMVANMHQGPKTRGTDRLVHQLVDGSEGDVYRVLLLALSRGTPTMSLPYPLLMDRIREVCTTQVPSGGSIVQACRQLDAIAKHLAPSERVIEWDAQDLTGTLSIVNPYFLFYLRCSRKLERLGGTHTTRQQSLPMK